MEKELKKEVFDWLKSIVLAIIIAIIIKTFVFNTTYVLGNSMYPTLEEKDRLFTSKIDYLIGSPKRGDIVILDAPDNEKKDYIKRVIGVEGDKVEIKNGEVILNGESLKESYIESGVVTEGEVTVLVPKEEVFVLGDNRNRFASKDSRYFGTVSIKKIKGKAVFRYYPFGERFGSIK